MSKSYRICGATCNDVHRRVDDIHLGMYLEAADRSQALRAIATKAAEIAQEYGAEVVRSVMYDHIIDLDDTISDLRSDKAALERTIRDLEDRIKELEDELNQPR